VVTRNLSPTAEECLPLVIDGISAEEPFKQTENSVYVLLLCNSDLVALTFYMRDNIPCWSFPHVSLPEFKQRWPGTRFSLLNFFFFFLGFERSIEREEERRSTGG